MPRPLSIDRDRVVEVDRDVDLGAVAGQRFVDRVVDDFVDEVMQAGRSGRPDVHGRALADGLEAFEDLDACLRRSRRVPSECRGGVSDVSFGLRHQTLHFVW